MSRTLSLTTLFVAASFVACPGGESDFPEIEDWSRTGEVLTFDADNLWEYIDGAAELFLEYDVQTCRTVDLASGDLVVTVDLYDMGTPLNAFGVFRREHPEPGMPLSGATEAVISPPYQALLLKGATYVKLNAVEGELNEATARELLEALAGALPGATEYPAQLELLPKNGKVAGSEGYKREGFLGLTELTHCLYAEYAGEDDETWQGFVMLPPTGSSPDAVWEALTRDWASLEGTDQAILHREVPYRGLVGVAKTDDSIVGVAGAADQAVLLRRLGDLLP